jgi:GGDEF domain-containing protein
MTERKNSWMGILGRILCLLGFHNFRVINVTFGFSAGNTVEKIECTRCKLKLTRLAK